MSLTDSYIVFELAGAAYAVRSDKVQHLETVEHVTRVPNAAASVDGVVFSRGQVFPALNLRARFGLPREPYTPQTRLIFLRLDDRVVGLIVDSAREFRRLAAESIRPVHETLVGIQGNHVEGVATVNGRTILILDIGAVLTLEESTLPAGAPDSPSTETTQSS